MIPVTTTVLNFSRLLPLCLSGQIPATSYIHNYYLVLISDLPNASRGGTAPSSFGTAEFEHVGKWMSHYIKEYFSVLAQNGLVARLNVFLL